MIRLAADIERVAGAERVLADCGHAGPSQCSAAGKGMPPDGEAAHGHAAVANSSCTARLSKGVRPGEVGESAIGTQNAGY